MKWRTEVKKVAGTRVPPAIRELRKRASVDSISIETKVRDIVAEDKRDALIAMAEPDEDGVLCVLVVECE